MASRKSSFGISLISFICLLAIWNFVALWVNSRLFPLPLTVLHVLLESIEEGELQYHVSYTLMRVFISFVLEMTLGIGIGIVLGISKPLDRFSGGWYNVAVILHATACGKAVKSCVTGEQSY